MLLRPSTGATIPRWSKPIEALAPEETDTPDPTSFPDLYFNLPRRSAAILPRRSQEPHYCRNAYLLS